MSACEKLSSLQMYFYFDKNSNILHFNDVNYHNWDFLRIHLALHILRPHQKSILDINQITHNCLYLQVNIAVIIKSLDFLSLLYCEQIKMLNISLQKLKNNKENNAIQMYLLSPGLEEKYSHCHSHPTTWLIVHHVAAAYVWTWWPSNWYEKDEWMKSWSVAESYLMRHG